jgi:hypothetical protein
VAPDSIKSALTPQREKLLRKLLLTDEDTHGVLQMNGHKEMCLHGCTCLERRKNLNTEDILAENQSGFRK